MPTRLERETPVSRHAELRAGATAMAPMLVAYAPFGLVVGTAVAASAAPGPAWLVTWGIYGGAAHLATLDVLHDGAGWPTAAAVGLLVNARLLAYATAMAPQWRSARAPHRALAGVVLTDAPWAMSRDRGRRYYLGAALVLWFAWPLLVGLGAVAGRWVAAVPGAGPVLDLLPALTLGAVVAPQLRHRPVAAACAAAAGSAVLTTGLSSGVAFVVAAAAGVAGGLVAGTPVAGTPVAGRSVAGGQR